MIFYSKVNESLPHVYPGFFVFLDQILKGWRFDKIYFYYTTEPKSANGLIDVNNS